MDKLYKFVGGTDEKLLVVFEAAIVQGTVRLVSAASFNDPFEFKFSSVKPPSRAVFDQWHDLYYPSATVYERDYAWLAFSGPAADWNTVEQPRRNLLGSAYVLCLAQRWNSHLMWAHYASAHRGFVICYTPAIVTDLKAASDHCMHGAVQYSGAVPKVRWFDAPPGEIVGPVMFTKSDEWAYEREYRVVVNGLIEANEVLKSVDCSTICGVILGANASEELIQAALSVQARRPGFTVQQADSRQDSYELTVRRVEANVRYMSGSL